MSKKTITMRDARAHLEKQKIINQAKTDARLKASGKTKEPETDKKDLSKLNKKDK